MKISRHWRTNLLLLCIIFCGFYVMSRLFYLQVVQRKQYKAQALGQQVGFATVTGSRGEIFFQDSQDSKGAYGSGDIKSLSINRDSWSLLVTVSDLLDIEKFAEILSPYIDIKQKDITDQLTAEDNYVTIKKGMSSDDLKDVQELNLKGLYW